MTSTTNASQEYLKSAVTTASPEQLQLMLFDGAIRFAARGLEMLRAKDIAGTFTALDRAQRITLQMMDGLNRDANPVLVDQMRGLLDFIYRRLIDGNLYKDGTAVEEAIRLLKHQRETWVLLMQKVTELQSQTGGGPPLKTPAGAVSTGRPKPVAARPEVGMAESGISLEG